MLSGATDTGRFPSIARSTDNGETWDIVTNALLPSAFAKDSLGTLFCVSSSSFGDDGVFRSTDQGLHWTPISGDLTFLGISSICLGGNGTLVIGSVGLSAQTEGLFVSTDDGVHWNQKLSYTGAPVTVLRTTRTGTIVAGTDGGGIFRSTDAGQTWQPADSGLTNLVVHAFDDDSLAGIFAGTSGGIFRSSDDGVHWVPQSEGMTNPLVYSIASSPEGFLLAGTYATIFRSTNGGILWDESSAGVTGIECGAIVCNNAGTVIVTAGGAGAIYRSTDRGLTWTPAAQKGLANKNIHCLTSAQDGSFYAGVTPDSDGIDLFRSTDQGGTWTAVGPRLPGLPALCVASRSGGEVVFGTPSGDSGNGLYRSTNSGESWQILHTGLANVNFQSLALSPSGFIYAGSYGDVIVSTDSGVAWKDVSDGLAFAPVLCLASGPSGGILAAQNEFGAYILSGGQWLIRDNGVPLVDEGSMLWIAFDSLGNVYAASGAHGVYTGNASWKQMNSGLTDSVVNSLCAGPGGVLYAATGSSGVFRYGGDTSTSVLPVQAGPVRMRLEQNYPNPFNPKTVVSCSVPPSAGRDPSRTAFETDSGQ